jgi:hypothetical protein
LEDVAQELRNSGFHEFGEPPHAIRDINGNTVGEWEVTR